MNSDQLNKSNTSDNEILTNVRYICKSSSLIKESLQKGCDVTQMPNGDIIITEAKIVNIQYTWDTGKNKMARLGGSTNKK